MPEIIPRPKLRTPSWIKLFLAFSLVILGGSLFSYFGLGGVQNTARQEIDQTHQEMLALATAENQTLEKEVKIAQYQVNNFAGLLASHQKSSAFFDLFKSVVHPGVVIKGFNLDMEKTKANLKGQAESFQDIGEQVLALRQEVAIKEVTLSELSQDEEGNISFSLDLALDPALFKAN